MSPVFRRCLFGVSTLILSGLVPHGVPGFAMPVAQAQTAPNAAEDTEADPPKKRGRRGREAAKDSAKDSAKAGKTAPGKTASGKTAPGMQQATPVAIFGDWNVFALGQGKTRVCYAIAQPQVRTPKTLKRDTAYLFVTVRKGENIQNEVAVMLGFPVKPAESQTKPPGQAASTPAPADPTLNLGSIRYGLVVKDGNAWLQNPGEETRVVTEMNRTPKLIVKATSMRGGATSDEYALAGFNDAMKRAREECR